jgi:hypothetical protein
MRRVAIRRMLGSLGMALVLLLTVSTPVRGDHTPPSQSGSLFGELFAFVGDFGDWNAKHGNIPLEIMEIAPADEEGAAFLLLFWLWLHDGQVPPGGNGSANSPPGTNPPSSPSPPSVPHIPFGMIVPSPSGDAPTASSSNGGTSDAPASGGSAGSGSGTGSSPLPSNGYAYVPPPSGNSTETVPPSDPGGNAYAHPANGGSTGLLPLPTFSGGDPSIPPSNFGTGGGSTPIAVAPPSTSGSGNNGQNPAAGSSPIGSLPGPTPPPSVPPVPEPPSFALLAVGGIGLLLCRRMFARKP